VEAPEKFSIGNVQHARVYAIAYPTFNRGSWQARASDLNQIPRPQIQKSISFVD